MRELSRLGVTAKATPAVPEQTASVPAQKVHVEIHFKNEPPGTKAIVRSDGHAGIHYSMDGLGAGQ